MISTAWYYAQNQQHFGPIDFEQLRHLAASGHLRATDSILKEGTRQWVPASSLPGLFAVAAPGTSQSTSSVKEAHWLATVKSLAAWLLQESREILVATWAQTLRL